MLHDIRLWAWGVSQLFFYIHEGGVLKYLKERDARGAAIAGLQVAGGVGNPLVPAI